jgi:hypothetical protein
MFKYSSTLLRIVFLLMVFYGCQPRMVSPPPVTSVPPPERMPADEARTALAQQGKEVSEKGLFKSLRTGDHAAAAQFIDAGISPDALNRNKKTPLIIAAERGDARTVYVLLERDADILSVDRQNRSALFYASRSGNAEAVKMDRQLSLRQ